MNLTPVPKLADLIADGGKVSALPLEAIPALLGELEQLKATLWARLTVPGSNGNGRQEADRRLSAKEAAARMGMSLDYVYKNYSEFPFAAKEGRRVLFSERGLEHYLQGKMEKKEIDM